MAELLKYSVGLDVSKEKFDACFSVIDTSQKVTIKSTRKFKNSPTGIKELINWSNKHRKSDIPMVFLMEATGVYYENIALTLHKHNYKLVVVLPNKGKRYMQSIGFKSKNDKIDAKGLSQMGAEQRLPFWQPFSEKTYELRSLTRQNEKLQEERTVILNRIESQTFCQRPNNLIMRQLKSMLKLIEKQIVQIKLEIEKCICEDEDIKEKVEKIETIKGLGRLTIATIIAETNGFLLFKNQKQLVSYAGYDIVENQSGKRNGKTRISKKGNSHIRRALHMPALNVVKYNPCSFGKLYERVYDSSKMKMKGYVAVQRKLLVLVYVLWKKNETYDNNYQTSGNDKQKSSFCIVSGKEKSPSDKTGTLDKLQYKESHEVLFLQKQN